MILHWSVDPILFQMGPVTVRYYGLLFASSFALAYFIVRQFFKNEGKNVLDVESLLIATIVGTSLGARLGHCLFYEPELYLKQPWLIFKVWEGGLASHGALIGILASVAVFVRFHKGYDFLWVMDRICIPVASGGFLIRIGNFFNSEILGKPTDGTWGVIFEHADHTPRHPAQIYEALFYLGVFFFLLKIYKNRAKWGNGHILGSFLVLIFGFRFFVEFFKENQVFHETTWMLNTGQWLSIPSVLLGVYLIWKARGSLAGAKVKSA